MFWSDYKPLNYEQMNLHEGTYVPSDFHDRSYSFAYWVRALFQRASYIFDFNVPFKGSEFDFFLYALYKVGYVAIYNDSDLGIVFSLCGLNGYNFYYQPTEAIIQNPYYKINTKTLSINSEDAQAVIIKLTPDYRGIWDIITYYAKRLASIDPAIDVSIANNKTPFIAYGRTKSAIQTLKKLVDKIQTGVSAVFYDARVLSDGKGVDPIEFLDRPNMQSSYLTTMQISDQQRLLSAFDREIGIPTLPYEKKERLVEDEANSMIIDSQSRAYVWCKCLNESFEVANRLLGTNMSVKLKYEMKGGLTDGTSQNNSDRP